MRSIFYHWPLLLLLIVHGVFAYVPIPDVGETGAQANRRFMEFLFSELDFLGFSTGDFRDLYQKISDLSPQEGEKLFLEPCGVFKTLLYQISEHKPSDFHPERLYLPALAIIYHEYLHLDYRLRKRTDRASGFMLLLKKLSKEAYQQEIYRHLQTTAGNLWVPDKDDLPDLLDIYVQEELFSFFTHVLALGVEKSYAVLDFNMNPENFSLVGLQEFGTKFAFPPDSALHDLWIGEESYPFTEIIFAGERLRPVKRLKLSLEMKEKLAEFILSVDLVKDTAEIVLRLNKNEQLRQLLAEEREKYLQQRQQQLQNDFDMDDDSIFIAD